MTHDAKAYLDLPSDRVIPVFRAAAAEHGLASREVAGNVLIALGRGSIRLGPEAGRTAIRLEAGDATGLQDLRDLLAERAGDMGVAIDWQTRAAGGRPANFSLARIAGVARLSPSYARVTIEGPDLGRFAAGGMHFRILMGPVGADWPGTDAGGVTRWPGGIGAWHRPVYTTQAIELPDGAAPGEPGPARMAFDVFLHEGGQVTEWTRRVRAGDPVGMTGPGGSRQPEAGWLGIVGDETAVPVAARMLAGAPAGTRGEAVLFVPESGDVQELPHPPGVRLRWVLRGTGETPVEALAALRLPGADRFVFFAAERAEALAARAHLARQGLSREEFLSVAYWSADGAAQ